MKKLITSIAIFSSAIFLAQETPKKDSVKTKNIEGVTMTKKVFQKKADRLIYDVANSPIAKGSTAFELIKETPMISATDGKTIKILGKNASVIYINGRKSNMDAEAVLEMLKSTPAENISKIEVITVPSSEFQVESNEGIINIVLKKKPTDGLNGNLKLEDTQSYYNNPSASLSLNYRKGKLGISGNVNTGSWTQQQKYLLANGNNDFKQTSEGTVTDPNLNLGGYINLDYEINEKQNLGFSFNSRLNQSNNSRSNLYNEFTEFSSGGITRTRTKNVEDAHSSNNSLNLNYELKTDDKGSKLSLSSSYLHFQRIQENNNATILLNSNKDEIDILKNFSQKIPLYIDNVGIQADYIQKLKKDFTLSFGGSYNTTKTDSETSLTNILPPTGIDTNQSNHFEYQEQIPSAYVTLEKNFGEKFTTKIGSRFEATKSEGNVVDKNIKISRNFENLLPYVSFNYAPNQNHNLSYSFSSRIRRPSFWQINPARIYLTATNYVQNNPFMKAETYYNQELSYMHKSVYFVTVSHSFVKDASEQIPLQGINEKGENVLAYVRTNYGDKQEMGVTFGMQKQFFKGIWNANNSLTLGRNTYKGTVDKDPTDLEGKVNFDPYVVNRKTNYLQLQFNNTIRLTEKKDWFVSINYFYLSPIDIEIGKLSSLQNLDISFKKIWKNWTGVVEVTDVFGTNVVNIYGLQTNGNYNSVNQNRYARQVTLSATYTFGNQKLQKARKIEGANSDVKSRTGGN